MTQQAPQKRGLGCLGYGCIIAVVIIFLTIGGLFFLARYAMRNAVERFTTEQPLAVPTVMLDEATRAALGTKLGEFSRVMKDPTASGEFALTQNEVGGLLAGSPLEGKAFIELSGDTVGGTFSFPLSALGQWDAARPLIGDYLNRYATGSAKAKLSVTNGVASVTLENLELNGQVFDGDALKEASEWVTGFANSKGEGSDDHSPLERFQSLRLENGTAVIRVKPQ
jgi:hypothetical protein